MRFFKTTCLPKFTVDTNNANSCISNVIYSRPFTGLSSLSPSLSLSLPLAPPHTHTHTVSVLPQIQRRSTQCSREKPLQPRSLITACHIPVLEVHRNFPTGQHATWGWVALEHRNTSILHRSPRQRGISERQDRNRPQAILILNHHRNGA